MGGRHVLTSPFYFFYLSYYNILKDFSIFLDLATGESVFLEISSELIIYAQVQRYFAYAGDVPRIHVPVLFEDSWHVEHKLLLQVSVGLGSYHQSTAPAIER